MTTTMKIGKRFARATMTLALTVLTTATAWAQEGLTYNTAGDTCTIHNATGWNAFCILLENNAKGYFAGKTVVLGADITINRAAGQDRKDFTGTFDGGGHTITLAFGTDEEHPYKEHAAVFRNTEYGAKIQNLNVKGTIYTNSEVIYDAGLVAKAYGGLDITDCTSDVIIYTANKCAGGFVGYNGGTLKIANCQSNAIIHSTVNGDGTHGGFVGESAGTVNIEGCVFTGKMLTTNGTAYCGGFVGWSKSTTSITNSLYAPAAISNGETEVLVGTGDYTSCTFGRNNANVTLTNSYYTRTLGTAQGKQARTVKAGDNVTVALSGTAKEYNVSGITAYANGLAYNQALYVSSGDKLSLTLSATPAAGYQIGSYIANGGTLTGNTLTMPDADVTISATFSIDPAHFEQTGTNEYTIKTEAGWNVFCDALQDNAIYNHFTGMTVVLADNIAVTRMAGSADHNFCGTFDGKGKTLTVHYTNTGNDVRTAPFSYISGATIMNLIVGGSITGTAYRAAGIVGEPGNSTIVNCVSSVEISSGRYTGGFSIGGALTIRGCVFNGKINGTARSGGFVGYGDESLVIDDCLFAPQDSSSINGGTFVYGSVKELTNSYYTCALGSAQGKQAHTITAGDNVTVALCGTATEYDVSGITAYSEGILYNNAFYAGSGDELSLSLGNTAPSALHTFTGYTVSAGTLTGNKYPYTLTMPDADVTIGADFSLKPVTYIDADGKEQTCSNYTVLTGKETSLAAGWYVVADTIYYTDGILLDGDTHIILCDGASLNIGTAESPVNGSNDRNKGFCGYGYNLSIYGQSGNTGALTIYSKEVSIGVKNLTLAGGNVNVTGLYCVEASGDVTFRNVKANLTATSSGASGIYCNNLTVDRSQLEVSASGCAIEASGDITLVKSNLTATSSRASGIYCSNLSVDSSQLEVSAAGYAIQASGVITLGCTTASDYIQATSRNDVLHSYSGTVKIADGQTLYAGSQAYTGTLTGEEIQAIGGQKLTNVAPPTCAYIGLDGTESTHFVKVISADNMPTSLSGWYVVQDTVNYTTGLKLSGDAHIILADNAVMNVSSGSSRGIQSNSGNSYSLYVYGQSGQSGELNVTSNSNYAIYIVDGDITIAGGNVTAKGTMGIFPQKYRNKGGNVKITNGKVTATGTSNFGIFACDGDIIIEGGQISATGSSYDMNANNITLGLTDASDYITASSYNGTVKIADGQTLYAGIQAFTGTLTAPEIQAIGGQKLTNVAPPTYAYIGLDGAEVTGLMAVVIDADNMPTSLSGWYVVQDTVNYTTGLKLSGDTHIILADNAVMNVTAGSSRGIESSNGSAYSLYVYGQSGQSGELNVTSNSDEAIYILAGDITIAGGHVTVSGTKGLFADKYNSKGGNVTIQNATVESTGTSRYGYGIYAYNGGDITFDHSNVTVKSTSSNGIHSEGGGNVIIRNGGKTTVESSSLGIYCEGDVTIEGGQVSVTGKNYGIVAWTNKATGGNITLGWTNASDYIYINKCIADGGTLSIADGKIFVDEEGTLHTAANVGNINGKTLRPLTSIPYLDENGKTQYCTEFTLLTENYTDYSNGWYVAIGTLNYTRGISFGEDAHLILADGCQVNIGTSESSLDDNGIFSWDNFTLYGQSTGDDKGILNIYSKLSSIEAGESITINGGHIIADIDNEFADAIVADFVTINGGIVDAYSHASTALYSSNVTINGGIVNVEAFDDAIYASSNFCYNGGILNVFGWNWNDIKTDNGNYNFSWSNPSDSIVFVRNGLYVEDGFTATFNKLFTDAEGNYYIGTLTGDEIDVLAGKTLRPCTAVTLADTDFQLSEKLSELDGATLDVTLSARTIDTEWNTLALPFDVSADTLAAVFGDGVKLYELTGSSLDENVLGLNFTSATSIEAGKPYFIAASSNVVNPVFKGVTIKASDSIPATTSYVDFIPTLGVSEIQGDRITDVLVLGGNNTLYNPASLPAKMKAFRGYFRVHDYSPVAEAMQFRMTFDDATEDDVTGIIDVQVKNEELRNKSCDAVYNLMGVRVKSTDKGLFIVKGKKVIVK